jgi:3-oxoacyl-[acyl-carrier protein] reductase
MVTPLTDTQLLQNKHTVIFGAGGAVGTAVAKEFALMVPQSISLVVERTMWNRWLLTIIKDSDVAYAAEVDALDEQAANAYLDRVAKEGDSIDILLNVMVPF